MSPTLRALRSLRYSPTQASIVARIGFATVYVVGNSPQKNFEYRMRYRQHISEGEGVGLFLTPFHHNHGNLVKSKSKIDQHAKDLGLKTKPAGIRVPTHDVMAQMYGQAIIIVDTITGDQIDESRVSFGD